MELAGGGQHYPFPLPLLPQKISHNSHQNQQGVRV